MNRKISLIKNQHTNKGLKRLACWVLGLTAIIFLLDSFTINGMELCESDAEEILERVEQENETSTNGHDTHISFSHDPITIKFYDATYADTLPERSASLRAINSGWLLPLRI